MASKRATFITEQNTFDVKFYTANKEEFFSILNDIKSLPGRTFNSASKIWKVPNNEHNLDKLKSWGFEIIGTVQARETKKTSDFKLPENSVFDSFFSFQKEGVKFIEENEKGVLLSDEMGLGKTLQAIGYLDLHKDYSALIICPASLKLNWLKEIKKWYIGNQKAHVVQGRSQDLENIFRDNKIIIMNYSLVSYYQEIIKNLNIDVLVCDECHFLKNSKAKRTKAVKSISKKINKKIIAISGTPIVNRPVEFFNTLNMLQPKIWNSFWAYATRYCAAKQGRFGMDFSGASNEVELNDILSNSIMIRRIKDDVLKDLPIKMRTVIPLELSDKDRKLYTEIEDDFIKYLYKNGEGERAEKLSAIEALAKIEVLKQELWKLKKDSVVEWIENYLESGKKLVVFAVHKKVIDYLMKNFNGRAVKIDGSVKTEDRNNAVELFQNNDKIRLFIGNIKAAGTGLTLTAADATCTIELGWTPADHDQAEDRVHRIGQKSKSVNAYYILVDNTIETDISNLLDEKRKIVSAVLDGKKPDEKSLLSELLNKYKKKRELS